MNNLIVSLLLLLSPSIFPAGKSMLPDYVYENRVPVLMIYGGSDHDVYLGKINASRYDSESIWNPYGTYGSKYNSKSIWNEYGRYGGKYSAYSPFNPYASHPPVLVDSRGNFYGYFTANKYKIKRSDYSLIDIICENYEIIKEDVGGWYDKIFY